MSAVRHSGWELGSRPAARANALDRASLLESALDAIITIDAGQRIREFNPSAERMFGYTRAYALGRRLPELVVPERFREAHTRGVLRAGTDPGFDARGHRFEVTALRADGSELPVELTITRAGTEPLMLTAFIRDLSDRKRAEEALRRSEERFMRAFADAPVGIALVSVEPGSAGRVLNANRALSVMTGYGIPALREMELDALTHPDDLGAGEALGEREQRIVRADGRLIWALVQSSVARDADGRAMYAIAQFHDVTERRALERRLRHLADHDPLTGLLNRRGLERALAARLADRRPGGALLMLDLDHFKFVNDSLGHAVGDEVIRAVAGALGAGLGDRDRVARLGGDEFALILDEADEDAALAVAWRLIGAVERGRPRGLAVSASVGVAAFRTGERSPSEQLVAADIALFEAKSGGRAAARAFSGGRGSALTWVERIRTAVDEDRFVLYGQPIVDLATGTVVHEELLIRMLDDGGDVVAPGAFLPTAEAYGLIRDIDRWVVARGVELAARGRRVHVNLSGASMGSTSLLDELGSWLRSSGADPALLVIELTETCAIANVDHAQFFAAGLRELGCRLALDDFGTGFGSFTYLKHLQADYLKIDMEFVRQVAHSEMDRRVVDSIVGIADAFGQRTIAEGVEDAECVAALRAAGVSLAQGYHLGRPEPVELE